MKIIVIGDSHGENTWAKIINKEKDFDKVIFLGDYWDSFTVSPKKQKLNYIKIQEFRDSNPDKIITLLGNHDYHYIYPVHYSGWKPESKFLATPLLEVDIKLGKLPFIYQHEDIIFSHAGITNYWLENIAKCTLFELRENEVQLKHFDWNSRMGNNDWGDTVSNSPLWVRPYSLQQDMLEGYRQVIGHTYSEEIENYKDVLYFCDSLPAEYLVITDGVFEVKQIKE